MTDKINSLPSLKLQDHFWNFSLFWFFPNWLRPNHITVFRLLATPWVVFLLLVEDFKIGIPVFILVALTDSIDGSLARVRNQITEWGKIWDPIADKILIGSVIYVFVMKYLDFYLGLFIIIFEIAFILLGWFRLKRGHNVEANNFGKIKMFLQVIGVLMLLLGISTGWTKLLPFSQGTFYLAVIFAVLSLLTHGI